MPVESRLGFVYVRPGGLVAVGWVALELLAAGLCRCVWVCCCRWVPVGFRFLVAVGLGYDVTVELGSCGCGVAGG